MPADQGYQQIPIVLVDANPSYNGGYHEEVIYLNPGNMWNQGRDDCNVWEHEVLHAWGYSHADMRHLFNCGNF